MKCTDRIMAFCLLIPIGVVWICSCGSKSPSKQETTVQELALRQQVSGTISQPGEVDWYHFRAVEANSILQVNCATNTYRSDEELLVTVYRQDADGSRVRLMADHAPEGSYLPAQISLNIYIHAPQDIYISVRDLMDDESSNNPYYLMLDFASGPEGNENFAQALPLIVDDPESCRTDSISSIGDIDCFRFTAPADGVYDILVDFNPFSGGTQVRLALDLYDSQGVLAESFSTLPVQAQGSGYHLLPHLAAGEYYVLIEDYGRDDFDQASTYKICLASCEADEQDANDTRVSASSPEYDAASRTFTAEGSLDYLGDQDWYCICLDDITASGCKVLAISFDDQGQGLSFTYQLTLEDAGGAALLSHNYCGGSTAYQNQIKAGAGDHYLAVQAAQGEIITQPAPYRVLIEVLDVSDPAEDAVKIIDPDTGETALGNNTIDTADILVSDSLIPAKIAYRGDEDWYRIRIEDTGSPRVLEVFLDTNSQASPVDYSLSLVRDEVIRRAFDNNGEPGPAELKMSVLVPAQENLNPLSYFLRVCDYQGDNGDGLNSYRVQANIRNIPQALPPDPAIDQNAVIYYGEIVELADESADSVKLEHTSLTKKEYRVNTRILDFHDPNRVNDPNRPADISPKKVTIAREGDQATISFPWIAGYIDFQGDQDWFQIDLAPLEDGNQPAPDQWYYDIIIDFHVGDPGSEVEYVWKLYRDWNQNRILVDRPRDSDGFMASAGDIDTDVSPFEVTIPAGENQKFWIGDAWEGKFYLSISDFNYVNSAHPDDDWGYTGAPYSVRVTLKYHTGQSYPQE